MIENHGVADPFQHSLYFAGFSADPLNRYYFCRLSHSGTKYSDTKPFSLYKIPRWMTSPPGKILLNHSRVSC